MTTRDLVTDGHSTKLTNAAGFLLLGTGVLKAWLLLAVGCVVGYALAAAIAAVLGLLFMPVSRVWFDVGNSIPILGKFGIAGLVIEIARVQGEPRGGSVFHSWVAAPRLRFVLFAVVGIAAVGVGLFAGLTPCLDT
jgi:hypothetical protein